MRHVLFSPRMAFGMQLATIILLLLNFQPTYDWPSVMGLSPYPSAVWQLKYLYLGWPCCFVSVPPISFSSEGGRVVECVPSINIADTQVLWSGQAMINDIALWIAVLLVIMFLCDRKEKRPGSAATKAEQTRRTVFSSRLITQLIAILSAVLVYVIAAVFGPQWLTFHFPWINTSVNQLTTVLTFIIVFVFCENIVRRRERLNNGDGE